MGVRSVLTSTSLVLAVLAWAPVVHGDTIRVGPDRDIKTPGAAAGIVSDGDVVEIDPGEYFDCAVWEADRIRIVGMGPGVVLTDKTCEGKAIFVIRADDVHVENITFTRARVPDANGAGIRMEGKNLVVTGSRFVNNENGILAAPNDESIIEIRGSEFIRNGSCDQACAHGIYVNAAKLLRIVDSKFLETRVAHHVKSRAQRTEIIRTEIRDGSAGTSSYLIDIPNGGSLLVEDSVLEKGPETSNRSAAIMIGAEGVSQRTAEISVRGSRFHDLGGRVGAFLVNRTATEAELIGNSLNGARRALVGDGTVR